MNCTRKIATDVAAIDNGRCRTSLIESRHVPAMHSSNVIVVTADVPRFTRHVFQRGANRYACFECFIGCLPILPCKSGTCTEAVAFSRDRPYAIVL
jgi:hypothetical protein